AIGVGLERHGGHLSGLWMGVAPSHLGLLSQICLRLRFGEEQPRPATPEIPLTERRMVLYATQPKTLSPADPCNKVASGHSMLDPATMVPFPRRPPHSISR